MRQTEKNTDSNFLGKVVSFSTCADTMALENVTFQSIGNCDFVVGQIPKGSTKNGWADGKTAGIAWQSVTDFIIFDSADSYVEFLEISERE